MLKKLTIYFLSLMFVLGGINTIYAIDGKQNISDNEIELQANDNTFLTDLSDDDYAELGKYKIEKIKDNIYHLDEGTKALPGEAIDDNDNMTTPSSMYFIIEDEGVILIELGNGAPLGSEDEANAKTIIESIVGKKSLTILITHNHGDHTGFGTSTTLFENIDVKEVYISEPDYEGSVTVLKQFVMPV